MRAWWLTRRSKRPEQAVERSQSRRARWTRKAVDRWGMPALAVLGPLGLGTQLSAVVAVGFGVSSRVAFAWVGAGTVAWSVVAAVATVAGLSVAGIGA
jgi:uncharacterized membrane protein